MLVARSTRTALCILAIVLLAACATAPPQPAEDDGLVPVPTAMLDELFVDPTVPLSNYKRVMIDPIEISFRDGWRQQHPDLSDHDFEVLTRQLTTMLHDTLVKEFARGGYTLVESPDHDVLRVHASIVGAEFAGPEVGVDKSTRTYNLGGMTLQVQGFDGPSGALVARARDVDGDQETRIFKLADRTSTLVLAQQVFDRWAEKLRSAMDVAKVHAGARTPQQ